LTRAIEQRSDKGALVFIGLNPSTADEVQDDPTIRRCIGFARTWGFARLKVLNVFGFRSTNPLGLRLAQDPVGPQNMCTVAEVVGKADLVVCAWGALVPPGWEDQVDRVLELVPEPHCLGRTTRGSPRHPLYVPAAMDAVRYEPASVSL
jgi:hypothetical protein